MTWQNHGGGKYRIKSNGQWFAKKNNSETRGQASSAYWAEFAAKAWIDGR